MFGAERNALSQEIQKKDGLLIISKLTGGILPREI